MSATSIPEQDDGRTYSYATVRGLVDWRDQRIRELEAQLRDVKDGKGWYEDTPAGFRKHYTVNEGEEIKTLEAQIAESKRQWDNFAARIALAATQPQERP